MRSNCAYWICSNRPPGGPDRFGSLEHARAFCQAFFIWYALEHHHSGLGLMIPQVSLWLPDETYKARENILLAAYEAHPARFVRKLLFPFASSRGLD